MVEQQKQRIEQEITSLVDDVDKSFLRKMQMEMHLCAAKCCEDRSSPLDRVHRCVQDCSGPVTKSERYVQSQLQEFQGRLQRCVMQCNDDIKSAMPADPSDSDLDKYTGQFERCAVKCVDKHVDLIPNLLKTIKNVLSKGPNRIPDV